MERTIIQRLQAVIALMVGAFTFGVYLSSFQAQVNAFEVAREADANRVAGVMLDNISLKNTIYENKERIVHLEAILINRGG